MNELTSRSAGAGREKRPSSRRAVLDLAPLELDCMNTLWPMGEGTVREIRDRLAERLPRAYTTIMTIMDRLARKGIVERRKTGRAYVYRANLTAEDARAQALGHVIEKFFGGSLEALLSQAGGLAPSGRARAAAAGSAPSLGSGVPGASVPPASVIEPRSGGDFSVNAEPAESD
jgi:BlaI family transcriptional regulator, penicillinase repressor